jgi:hypothetical protein
MTLCHRDSLSEIKKIVEEGRPAFADTIQRTQSLRSSYPQIGVAESIYSRDDREDGGDAEEYASSIWSDREFDFDDLIVSSKVYRRALAAARAGKQPVYETSSQTNEQTTDGSNEQALFEGDLMDFSDAATITQKTIEQASIHGTTRDLAGLTLSEKPQTDSVPKILVQSVNEQTPSIQSSTGPNANVISADIRRATPNPEQKPPEASPATKPNIEGDKTGAPQQSTPAPAHFKTHRKLPQERQERYRKVEAEQEVAQPRQECERPSANTPAALRKGKQHTGLRICGKCNQALTGQFIRALGETYHLECFTCAVSCGHVRT